MPRRKKNPFSLNELAHLFFRGISRFLPTKIRDYVRRFFTALLTPIFFSLETGHYVSALHNESVDANQKPIPWITFPCFFFLKNNNLKEKTVLEFGSGNSTLWLAKYCKSVVSIEDNPEWYNAVKGKLGRLKNVEYHYIEKGTVKCAHLLKKKNFDIIFIDGIQRDKSFEHCIENRLLADRGIYIIDNAEDHQQFKVIKKYKLNKVDFYGHAPSVSKMHSTSLVFGDKMPFIFQPTKPIQSFYKG